VRPAWPRRKLPRFWALSSQEFNVPSRGNFSRAPPTWRGPSSDSSALGRGGFSWPPLTLPCSLSIIRPRFSISSCTYAIAKRWYPETVWNTPQFRTINLHLTYVWSCIFLISFLSSCVGQGRPLFSILIPLIFILGIGLPLAKIYPMYYLKREFTSHPVDPSLFPDTARELISRMPLGFNPEAAQGLEAEIQFDLSGEGGGKMVLSISGGQCTFREGEDPSPTLTIRSPAEVWMKMARGEIDRPRV